MLWMVVVTVVTVVERNDEVKEEETTVSKAQSGNLTAGEVNALREIAKQLGKEDWNFSLNPCDGNPNWTTPKRSDLPSYYNNTPICNCSYPGGVCHVESICLRGQDLAGKLPPSLAKLPFLKTIDLTQNYLSGTIPPEWASTKLKYMSVIVNRLSGRIPESLENNFFDGTVPRELGKLVNLENLILSANNLTGALPLELTNLIKLTELEIQASGFEGPIHSSISVLSNLTELRIGDLNGEDSEFPKLRDMTSMTKLMLRNCNISGKIPSYLAQMTELRQLDLSFNKLKGEIPNLEGLTRLEFMYLTNNFLTGQFPEWINSRSSKLRIDLSYNYLSEGSVPSTCQENLNLFRSYSGLNNSELGKCLRNQPCSKDQYSLYINCAGGETTIGKTVYEGDQNSDGPAKFVPSNENWGTSNTGHFWDRNVTADEYTANNVSILRVNNPELYTSARLFPLSLTYYGRCLANGNYTVTLHFAEIMLRDNQSFQSLGRRIFDVYIQGEQKLKDFDIEREAKGVDKVVKINFTAIVKDKSLEIRFHYAGKGTTAVPMRGVYGPLISAISVKYDFTHPDYGKQKIFIAIGAISLGLCLILIIVVIAQWNGYLGGRTSREEVLRGLDLKTGLFTFRQIKAATNNFDAANKLGEGGFGSVYKGILLDDTVIAVKQLSSKSRQGNREFVNEIGIISGLQHENLVKLYGCCVEGNQLLLVYEYMENNSLAAALFATNVLLDGDLNPKISDFGLAKLDEEENTHISTRVAGTIGYMAPEYALWGHLTYKADVYSFGIVALEIVAGKNNMKYRPNENYVCLLDWALVLQRKESLMAIVDPRLGLNFDKEEAIRMIKVALLCTNPSPALRPTMSAVVSMLQGRITIQEVDTDPSMYGDEFNFQSLRDKYDPDLQFEKSSETSTLLHSSDAPNQSSSTSALDLYPATESSI
ncbi:hypothetical protein LguiB_033911 [Lonicera macranthoides]